VYDGWQTLHRDCRAHEGRLQKELRACDQRLNDTSRRKQAACSVINGTDTAGDSENASNLVHLKRLCQDATRQYVDQWSICAEGERFYGTKRSECDSVQQSMETANCTRASQVSGVCDMYDLCRAGMSLAYTSAKEAARAWERYHEAEWLAVVTVRCFAENLGSKAENSSTLLGELEKCEQLVANTTLFDLDYKDVPSPKTCVPVTDSPCVDRSPQSRQQRSSAASVASAVAADEQAQGLPTAVSFVQEGIQRATVAFPHEVHEALLGTLATPGAIGMASFSFLLILGLARCMFHSREKEHRPMETKDSQNPLPVDAWCINSVGPNGGSAGTPGVTSGLQPAEEDFLWLCPELLVPKNSKCVIMVPSLTSARPHAASASFTVSDKMGQPLFRGGLSCAARAESGAGTTGAQLEQLTLTRHDGTSLASCQLELPEAAAPKQAVACRVLHRAGEPFASLKRECGQASWLSQVMNRTPGGDSSGSFIFASAAPGAWQLRVQGNFIERRLSFVDGNSRVVAAVERCRAPSFGQGAQECHRVEVGGELDTDLGLVTIILLAVDRMLGSAVGVAC